MKKWYRLGGNATSFWDPQQPDPQNNTLSNKQVKQFEETERVSVAKRGGGLVEITEKEAMELISDLEKAGLEKSDEGADALAEAARLNEDAAVKLKEAENKLKEVEATNQQNIDLAEENAKLKKALEKKGKDAPDKTA